MSAQIFFKKKMPKYSAQIFFRQHFPYERENFLKILKKISLYQSVF